MRASDIRTSPRTASDLRTSTQALPFFAGVPLVPRASFSMLEPVWVPVFRTADPKSRASIFRTSRRAVSILFRTSSAKSRASIFFLASPLHASISFRTADPEKRASIIRTSLRKKRASIFRTSSARAVSILFRTSVQALRASIIRTSTRAVSIVWALLFCAGVVTFFCTDLDPAGGAENLRFQFCALFPRESLLQTALTCNTIPGRTGLGAMGRRGCRRRRKRRLAARESRSASALSRNASRSSTSRRYRRPASFKRSMAQPPSQRG